MSSIENTIRKILENKKIFIPYIMIGDGGLKESEFLLDLYVKSGAMIIEIGVPFTDATADGIIIQESSKRALLNNISILEVLNFIKKASKKYDNVNFIIMTYLNPIISYGISEFFYSLNESGGSGVIIPDLPIEEYDLIYQNAVDNNISIIPLITLNTNEKRIKTIVKKSSGFIYVITIKGITGTKEANELAISELYNKIRKISDLPIIAGFGINNKIQAKRISQSFDGVIIASRLIQYAQNHEYDQIADLISCL